MFGDDDKDKPVDLRRRAFLGVSAAAVAGFALWSMRKPGLRAAARESAAAKQVTIVRFSDDGTRLQTVHLATVVKSEQEWRKQLSSNEFDEIGRASCRERVYGLV